MKKQFLFILKVCLSTSIIIMAVSPKTYSQHSPFPPAKEWYGPGFTPDQRNNDDYTLLEGNQQSGREQETSTDGQTSNKASAKTTIPLIASFSFKTHCLSVLFENKSAGLIASQWDFGDGNTSGEKNPVHQYEEDGTYTVTLRVQSEVGGEAVIDKEVTVEDCLDINEKDLLAQHRTFPNPSEGFIVMTFPGIESLGQSYQLNIYTLQGQTVQGVFPVKAEEIIYTHSFNKGLYFYTLKNEAGNTVLSGRFMVQ